jgi:hypothetical protein
MADPVDKKKGVLSQLVMWRGRWLIQLARALSLNQVIRTETGMSVPVQINNLLSRGGVTFVNPGLAHYELSVISCCIKTKQSLHNDA